MTHARKRRKQHLFCWFFKGRRAASRIQPLTKKMCSPLRSIF